MKNRKLMWEIILVSLAGVITVGLSINSIIKSNNQERELKAKQDSLTEAQNKIIQGQTSIIQLQDKYSNELKQKSDEIIKLQTLLQQKSEEQLGEIDRIKNPIPDKVNVFFEGSFDLSKSEVDDINAIYKQYNNKKGNLLPFDYDKTNPAFDKMNALKDMSFEINVIFENKEKTLSVRLNQKPMQITGYHQSSMSNVFLVAASDEQITLTCLDILTTDIRSNDKTPSIIDYRGAKVTIKYDFFYPKKWVVGNSINKLYMASNRDYITFNLKNLALRCKNYSIEVTNITRKDTHTFEGTWIVK